MVRVHILELNDALRIDQVHGRHRELAVRLAGVGLDVDAVTLEGAEPLFADLERESERPGRLRFAVRKQRVADLVPSRAFGEFLGAVR